MLGKTHNPLLMKVEQSVQSKLQPQFAGAFERIVTAGLKVIYSPQSQHLMLAELAKPGDKSAVIASGMVKLMGLLWSQGNGKLPMQAYIPASVALCCEVMSFTEQSRQFEVNPQTVAATIKEMTSELLQKLGVSPQKLQQMVEQAKQKQGAAPGQPAAPSMPGQPPAMPAQPPAGIIGTAQQGA